MLVRVVSSVARRCSSWGVSGWEASIVVALRVGWEDEEREAAAAAAAAVATAMSATTRGWRPVSLLLSVGAWAGRNGW